MASKCLADLKPGETFRDYLVLRSKIEQKQGNGPNVKFLIFDGSKECKAKVWKATDAEIQEIIHSQFLLISGLVDHLKPGYQNEITVTSYNATETPKNIQPFLKPLPKDYEDHVLRFEQLVLSVQEPNLRILLDKVFDKEKEIWLEFCSAYAAGKKHHAYPGGLLHHSVEVAELCASTARVIPTLSRDLLVACALLHDIGKLKEINHGLSAGEYTEAGILNGHISLGSSRVRQLMNSIKGFPSLLKEAVTHMLLSHHGMLEYGSPVLPKFSEAQVLAQCDLISARVFEYAEATKNANGQLSVWLSGKESIQIYTGDLGLQKVEEDLAAPEIVKKFKTTLQLLPSDVPAFTTTRMRIRGLVAAGSPEQGNTEDDEMREVVPPTCGADFLVRVTGDSMADEGIREQDLLFVKMIESPKNGDIVVAHVGVSGEVVKRFRCDLTGNTNPQKKWLESENSNQNYPDIMVDNDTRIRGKVVGLLRDF